MADQPLKSKIQQMGPKSIRKAQTTVTFHSVQDLIAYEVHCARQRAARNPKAAIRSMRLRKRKKGCCGGGVHR